MTPKNKTSVLCVCEENEKKKSTDNSYIYSIMFNSTLYYRKKKGGIEMFSTNTKPFNVLVEIYREKKKCDNLFYLFSPSWCFSFSN